MPEAGPVGAHRGVCVRAVARRLAIGDEFRAHDGDVARSVDAQPDLSAFQANDGDADVITDEESFQQLPGQHEHEWLPGQHPEVGQAARVGFDQPAGRVGDRPSRFNRSLAHILERFGA